MKPSLLLAVGCSWVAAKSIDVDPASTTYDYNHIEDPAVVAEYSFAGQLQKLLKLDQIEFIADSGSSNSEQVRKLIDFVETKKDQYSKIFVLWGITSIYRWEMYTDVTNAVEPCLVGQTRNPKIVEQVKYYFQHFWNEEYELEKLGNQIILVDAYLDKHNIEHVFFNSFQSYTGGELKISTVDKQFYHLNKDNNDMLSFLCVKNNVKFSTSSVPWLNLIKKTPDLQYNNNAVKELQKCGMLDCATAHPTIAAHKLIAEELYSYMQD